MEGLFTIVSVLGHGLPLPLGRAEYINTYNAKCRGKQDTTQNIPRSISFSPLHFVLYRGLLLGQCGLAGLVLYNQDGPNKSHVFASAFSLSPCQ